MGSSSIEEEELVYFIELDTTSSISMKSSKPFSQNHQQTLLALQDMLWGKSEAEREILEKIRNVGIEHEETTSLKKWVVMKLKMDGYEASLCKTSRVLGHQKGDYEYIDVIISDPNGGKPTRLIADMDFRSQFELAMPTPNYSELTNSLPSIFVGTEEKLGNLVSLICSAAKESLKEKGFYIPPWRKTSYMQSKWLSKDCKKVSVQVDVKMGVDESQCKVSNSQCSSNLSSWVYPILKL